MIRIGFLPWRRRLDAGRNRLPASRLKLTTSILWASISWALAQTSVAPQKTAALASSANSNLPAPAPAWSLRTTSGGSIGPANFYGKVVVLNFFDTTCDACSNEVPNLVLLQKNYATSGLQVIGIAVDPSPDHTNSPSIQVSAFGSLMHINYPLAMAQPGGNSVETDYGTIAFPSYGGMAQIPTTFVINRQNQVVQTFINGAQTYASFEAAVKPQLALSANPSIQALLSSGTMTLSWPVTPASFTLETTADLSKIGWSRVATSSVRSDGTNNFASIPPGATTHFFRLVNP